ncbi:O-antigen ligase family protein [Comamonas flocculans]|uniref:O-antigen ligase family protein n=1 Tax=Comamonas flocculans TaxID=2597701 RepID=A0A5B8RSL7_9BURK|nr:O-antigen ligase family protein [Comamonas flocculans]QEA12491.1 O-antigen ligase family protein [Comamonas flocculans]
MPNYLKAYIVVMAVGCLCYLLWTKAGRTLQLDGVPSTGPSSVSKRYFVAWALVTSAAFLASNYYVFILLALLVVPFVKNRVPVHAQGGLFVVLLLSVPSLGRVMQGFFGLNKIVELSWPMVLGLSYLLSGTRRRTPVGRERVSLAVILLFVLIALLSFRDTTVSDGFRETFVYFNLILVPYLIARKTSFELRDARYIYFGFTFIAIILSGMGVFTMLKHWNVYDELRGALDLPDLMITTYKYRGGFLRTSATVGAIHLAAIGSCAMVVFAYLIKDVQKSAVQKLLFLLLLLSVVFTFSRAPWIIGAGMVVWYAILSYRSRGIYYVFIGVIFVSVLLFATGLFDSVADGLMLKDSGNVDYRQRLLELGMQEIMQHPLTGNPHFMSAPRLQVLRQGEGIIDIVNTYLQVGLQYGLVAMVLFAGLIFAWPLAVYRRAKRGGDGEVLDAARVYMVIMVGLGMVIFTVSSFGKGSVFFPLLMFLVGMGHGIRKN